MNTNGYKILFDETSTVEFKYRVLDCMIKLYNMYRNENLGVVAELTQSICLTNSDDMTATFHEVGF
jgi:hypothetical protein